MKAFEDRPTTSRFCTSCRCNKCGQEMVGRFGNICGAEVYVEGCYESDVLEDCTTYEFDLCEYCLEDMFNSFMFPEKRTEHGIGE